MAVNRIKKNSAYSIDAPLLDVAPVPIVANRNPSTRDLAEIGTTWINQLTSTVYVLASISANSANWTTSPASGATILASLQVTGLGGIVVDQGDIDVTLGDINVAAGDVVIAGNLDVGGVATFTGDIDLSSAALIDLTSTLNADPSIYLHADGGANESILLQSSQGTDVDSVQLLSTSGGITLTSGLASADAINFEASVGGIDWNSALQSNIDSSQAAANAIRMIASDAAGGIDIDCGTAGIAIDSTGAFSIDGAAASNVTTTGAGIDLTLSSVLGSVLVSSTEDAALAIRLHANGGVSETIQLHSDQGTGVGSINLLSDVGGLTLRATGLASADAINFEAVAGGIDWNSALQSNIDSAQAAADAIRIIASDVAGGIDIDSGSAGITIDSSGVVELNSSAAAISIGNDAVAQAINVGTGAAARTITIGNISGATAVNVNSGTGGFNAVSTGSGDITLNSADTLLLDSAGVLELNSSAGVISIGNDAVAQDINVGTGAAARVITIGNVSGASAVVLNSGTGGVALNSTGAGDILLNSADTVLIDSAGVLELNSSAGVISIGNDAVAQNIDVGTGAAARTITIGNISGATAVNVNSGTGGFNAVSTGAGDITLNSADTLLLDSAGVLELNSSAGVIGIGNDAVAQAINIGTGAAARTITIGNATGASSVVLNAGTGAVNIGSNAVAHTVTVGSTTGAAATVIQAGTGAIALSASGAVSMVPGTATAASPTASVAINQRVFKATFTGFTTAAGSTQDFTITNSAHLAGAGVVLSVVNAGSNDAQMTIQRINVQTAGTIVVTVKNNGAAALNGNVIVTGWVID